MSIQGHSGFYSFIHFHTFFLTPSHTLHTLFTQFELFWPNLGEPYNFWCLKACAQAGKSKWEIVRVIQPLMRVPGPQKIGKKPLRWAEGPQKPSARARMVTLKGPYFLVRFKIMRYSNIFSQKRTLVFFAQHRIFQKVKPALDIFYILENMAPLGPPLQLLQRAIGGHQPF